MRKITTFSTPNCPYCSQLKDFLREKGVKFKEIDLSKKPEEAQKLIEKTSQMGVPVTIIKTNNKEKVVIGFNREELSKVLRL